MRILSVKGFVRKETLYSDDQTFELRTPGYLPEEDVLYYFLIKPNIDGKTWSILRKVLCK